jgi:hypothetical protein
VVAGLEALGSESAHPNAARWSGTPTCAGPGRGRRSAPSWGATPRMASALRLSPLATAAGGRCTRPCSPQISSGRRAPRPRPPPPRRHAGAPRRWPSGGGHAAAATGVGVGSRSRPLVWAAAVPHSSRMPAAQREGQGHEEEECHHAAALPAAVFTGTHEGVCAATTTTTTAPTVACLPMPRLLRADAAACSALRRWPGILMSRDISTMIGTLD